MIDTMADVHPVDALAVGDKLTDPWATGEVVAVKGNEVVVRWDDMAFLTPYLRPGLKKLWDDGKVSIKKAEVER